MPCPPLHQLGISSPGAKLLLPISPAATWLPPQRDSRPPQPGMARSERVPTVKNKERTSNTSRASIVCTFI